MHTQSFFFKRMAHRRGKSPPTRLPHPSPLSLRDIPLPSPNGRGEGERLRKQTRGWGEVRRDPLMRGREPPQRPPQSFHSSCYCIDTNITCDYHEMQDWWIDESSRFIYSRKGWHAHDRWHAHDKPIVPDMDNDNILRRAIYGERTVGKSKNSFINYGQHNKHRYVLMSNVPAQYCTWHIHETAFVHQ